MGKVNKRPLHLVIKNGNKQTVYLIDDYKSVEVMWSTYSNQYLISFKQYGKQMLISTKWFNISGKVYAEI